MKVPVLVCVKGGVAYTYEPEHVDCRVVDEDNINERGDGPIVLPRGIGFEQLVEDAELTEGTHYEWEDAEQPEPEADPGSNDPHCKHQWNHTAGEADELFFSGHNVGIRCVLCGADGDA